MQWITAEPSWFSPEAYRITLRFLEWEFLHNSVFYLFILKKDFFDAFFTQRGAVYSQICTQMNIKELFSVKRIIIIIQFSFCTIIATLSWWLFLSSSIFQNVCRVFSFHCCSLTNFWYIFGLHDVHTQLPFLSKSFVAYSRLCLSDGWVYLDTILWPSVSPKTSFFSAFAFDYKTTPGPRSFSGPVSRLWQLFSPTRAWAGRQSKPRASASPERRLKCVFSFYPRR